MPQDNLPPLRIKEQDGSPNAIPVFEIIVSNGTLTDLGGGKVRLATGAGGGFVVPLIVSSGGTGAQAFGYGGLIFGNTTDPFDSDSANLYWDNTSKYLAVGSTASVANTRFIVGHDANAMAIVRNNDTAFKSQISFRQRTVEKWAIGCDVNDNNKQNFFIWNNSLSAVAFYIDSNGIGIGNTSPQTPLDVTGSTRLSSVCILGSQATSAGHAVRADRLVNTGVGLIGGGNLSSDITLGINTAGSTTGQMLISSAGTLLYGVAWVNTQSTITRQFPLGLLTVGITSGNAYWQAVSGGTNLDEGYVVFVDSGEGTATYYGMVPFDVAPTPAWNLLTYSTKLSNEVGANSINVILNIDAISVTHNESSNGITNLLSAGSFIMQSAGIMTISTMSATNFDGVLAISAGDYVKVRVLRQGSNDTINSNWALYGLSLRCNVNI